MADTDTQQPPSRKQFYRRAIGIVFADRNRLLAQLAAATARADTAEQSVLQIAQLLGFPTDGVPHAELGDPAQYSLATIAGMMAQLDAPSTQSLETAFVWAFNVVEVLLRAEKMNIDFSDYMTYKRLSESLPAKPDNINAEHVGDTQ